MKSIGIIAPFDQRINNYSNIHFVKRSKPDYIFNEKRLLCFTVAYDNQNYNKIFRKNNVEVAVCAAGVNLKLSPAVCICDGKDFYKKNLLYFIAKAFKLYGLKSETASMCVFDNTFSADTVTVIKQSCRLFRYITLQTGNVKRAQAVSDELFAEYGITAQIIGADEQPVCDMFVEASGEECFTSHRASVTVSIGGSVPMPPEYSISLPSSLPFKVNQFAVSEALWHIKC